MVSGIEADTNGVSVTPVWHGRAPSASLHRIAEHGPPLGNVARIVGGDGVERVRRVGASGLHRQIVLEDEDVVARDVERLIGVGD